PDEDGVIPQRKPVRELVLAAIRHEALVILVLPKWIGRGAQRETGWIERADLCLRNDVSDALAAAIDRTVHADAIVRLSAPPPAGFQAKPEIAALPTPPRPQLLHPAALPLSPLVWSEEGVLAGTLDHGRILIISDPDLLNNSGLGQGDNAAVVHRLL